MDWTGVSRSSSEFTVSTLVERYKSKQVELTVGFVFLFTGVVLSGLSVTIDQTAQQALVATLGSLLSTGAGVLLSWSWGESGRREMSEAEREEAAVDLLRSRLEQSSRYLALVSTRIRSVLEEYETESVDPATAFRLVTQSLDNLDNCHGELQQLLGSPFNPDVQESALLGVRALGSKLASIEKMNAMSDRSGTEDRSGMAEELDEARELLAGLENKLAGNLVTEQVKCHHCSNVVRGQIGSHVGATKPWTCGKCERSFNVHRNGKGLFTRPFGVTVHPQAPEVATEIVTHHVNCPSCESQIHANVDLSKGETTQRYCMECYEDIEIDAATGDILGHGRSTPRKAILDPPSTLWCPDCNRASKSIYTNHTRQTLNAICPTCRHLMIAELPPPGETPPPVVDTQPESPVTTESLPMAPPLDAEAPPDDPWRSPPR